MEARLVGQRLSTAADSQYCCYAKEEEACSKPLVSAHSAVTRFTCPRVASGS